MTAACAKLDHTVYAIKLRCAEGLRAASTRKTPSAAKMVKNIGAVVPPVGRSARREVTSALILAPAVPRPNTTRTTCSARSRIDITAIEASPQLCLQPRRGAGNDRVGVARDRQDSNHALRVTYGPFAWLAITG